MGENITIPCNQDFAFSQFSKIEPVMWIKSGREDGQVNRLKILPNGSLSLEKVIKSDSGSYMCTLEKNMSDVDKINGNDLLDEYGEVNIIYKVIVRSKYF